MKLELTENDITRINNLSQLISMRDQPILQEIMTIITNKEIKDEQSND
jgi:hypothetical protein